MKFTAYFHATRLRPDRAVIQLEWILHVVDYPERESIQQVGRTRRWASFAGMDGEYLRVILLPDGETVPNAFFDRSFAL